MFSGVDNHNFNWKICYEAYLTTKSMKIVIKCLIQSVLCDSSEMKWTKLYWTKLHAFSQMVRMWIALSAYLRSFC